MIYIVIPAKPHQDNLSEVGFAEVGLPKWAFPTRSAQLASFVSSFPTPLLRHHHLLSPTTKVASIFRRFFGISASQSHANMADAASKANALIRDNAVMIFSKTTCPYCKHSKNILLAKQKEYEAKGTPFSLDIYELNTAREYFYSIFQVGANALTGGCTPADGPAIQDHVGSLSTARTVPRIFVAQRPLGGGDDLNESMKPNAKFPLEGYWLKSAVEYTAAHSSEPR